MHGREFSEHQSRPKAAVVNYYGDDCLLLSTPKASPSSETLGKKHTSSQTHEHSLQTQSSLKTKTLKAILIFLDQNLHGLGM